MTVAILQARMGSSRRPGKVLAPILGRPMILHLLDRIRDAQLVDTLVVATTTLPGDDVLADVLGDYGAIVRRGPSDDVLARFLQVMDEFDSPTVVRLTGDNPLVDAETVDLNVAAHHEAQADYSTNGLSKTFPHGLNVEVFQAAALRELAALPLTDSEREHVTLGMLHRPEQFKLHPVAQRENRAHLRWTVDYPEDLEWVLKVFEALEPTKHRFAQQDVVDLLRARPELVRTTSDVD